MRQELAEILQSYGATVGECDAWVCNGTSGRQVRFKVQADADEARLRLAATLGGESREGQEHWYCITNYHARVLLEELVATRVLAPPRDWEERFPALFTEVE